MSTHKSRLMPEDEEKIETKKPYSAPTLVELDGSLTGLADTSNSDGPFGATASNAPL